jgi:phosphoribosylanthranilate isomerase
MTRVKVCGITRQEDAEAAVALGADALGFVFWPRSPRAVAAAQARDIVAQLPPFVVPIGVFVDEPPDGVARMVHDVRLRGVQLHGDERVEDFAALPVGVVKAVALETSADADRALAVPAGVTVLLDARDPVRRGGTGTTIDWSLAATVARQRRIILSGGLTAANVADAIGTVRPYAVDVSSGVEQAPGIKDPARLRAFFDAVRVANPGTSNPEPSNQP